MDTIEQTLLRAMSRFLILVLIITSSKLYAEIHIEITQGVNSVRQIGIVPFQWSSSSVVPEDISNIIACDLRNSGRFNPLERSHLPETPSTVQEVQPSVWNSLGIESIVIGHILPNLDGSFSIDYQLVDVSNDFKNVLAQNSYKVNRQWLRCAGHTVSDEIFKKITGIKGAFRTRIAYVVETSNKRFPYELRVSDYDGYNQFVIYRSPQPLMSPAWSPDGEKLSYVTFEGGHSALVIQTLANGEIRRISSFPCHNGSPSFSPDGTKLAFALSKSGSLNLYMMNLTSGKICQITNNHNNNTELSWFPDSQSLAFTSDQSGHPQIYKVNINNGFTERLTWKGLQNQNATVSKDGKFIVMVSLLDGQQHIAKQDLATGNVQVLSSTFLDETPSIAPNDTMVIYSSSRQNKTVLNIVSIDGRFNGRFPATDGKFKFPAWSPFL